MSISNVSSSIAVMGKPGSGKSTTVKRLMAKLKPKRLLIWSPDEDLEGYARQFNCKLVRDIGTLVKEIASKTAPFRVVYWPSMNKKTRMAEFNYFCKLAFASANLTAIVEELKFVTTPQLAPDSWALLSARGRKAGVKLIGTSQRPAQIDKDFLGNCTEIYCGVLGYPKDIQTVAEAMAIKCSTDTKTFEHELRALRPLMLIHVTDTGNKSTETLKF